ncbi:DMT family transporter [Litorisediminicola beolgyonensis]|uniref:DMT family transporter n=1 Tax=Litorisediminicola beolgyonensis TaxID=1173614 RepID=A0ABW3ZMP2_9RHOB
MTPDRPLLGLLLMLAFCLMAPLADAVAKLLTGALPVLQLVVLRFAFQAILMVPFAVALRKGGTLLPDRSLFGMLLLRTLLHIAGIGLMFTALRYLPLADAIAIAFVMPFLLLLLGHLFLGEEVGPRRLAACAAGFVGTLLVVQPAFRDTGAAALLPLGVAVTFALFMLTTRRIAKRIEPVALQSLSGALATVLLLPLFALSGPGFDWHPLPTEIWALVASLGALGTIGHLLMSWSLRYAPSTTLAPMQYLEIPIATLYGWLIFGDWPNPLAQTGIAITIVAGLYIVLRERKDLRPPAAPLG